MKNRNELIYYIRQVIGQELLDGFYTIIKDQGEIVKVPNYLFKDNKAEYPEIRISPFIRDEEVAHPFRVRSCNRDDKIKHYRAIFQIDIYATNVVIANKIYDAVSRRVDLFNDYDTVLYGYNKSFKEVDDNLYFTNIYTSSNFNIFRILINNNIISKVSSQDLLENNTYIINEDGLYIQTTLPIQDINIFCILNGLTFSDGDIAYDKNIITLKIQNKKMLSELENNRVERIKFDLSILYNLTQERDPGPILEDISVK